MKKTTISKCLLLLGFTTSAFLFTGIKSQASGLSYQEKNTIEEGNITNQLFYSHKTVETTNDAGSTGTQNLSYVKTTANPSLRLVSYASYNKDGIVGKNVLQLAKEYEQKNPGYEVLAGINADYFYASNGIFYPINSIVSDGEVIKFNNHDKYASIYVDQNFDYGYTKQNTASSNFYLTIYDENGLLPKKEILLAGQNCLPSNGETTFFYKNTVTQTKKDTMFFEVSSPEANFNYASPFIKGKITGTISSTNSNPIIATQDEEIETLLTSNPYIRIQKRVTNPDNKDLVIGVGSQPLKDGVIQEDADIVDQNLQFCEARHPRSSIGFTSNHELVLAAIDGRQTNMAGATLREEALVMKELGCVDCFNFDGGGSTQLVIRKNNELVYLNTPSETYRSVVDVVLIVQPKVNTIASSSVKDDIFTYHAVYTNTTANLVKIETFLNGKSISYANLMPNEEVTEDNSHSLTANSVNNFCTVVTWTENGVTYQDSLYQKDIMCGEIKTPVHEKTMPNNFDIVYEKTKKGFDATVTCDDPDGLISKVYLISDGSKEIAIKSSTGYTVNFSASEDKDYTFEIMYYYKVNSITTESVTLEKQFTYSYDVKRPTDFKLTYKESSSGLTVYVTWNANEAEVSKVTLTYENNTIDVTTGEAFIEMSEKHDFSFMLSCDYKDDSIAKNLTLSSPIIVNYRPKSGCGNKSDQFFVTAFLSLVALGTLIYRKKEN